jgi:hypothetical protein
MIGSPPVLGWLDCFFECFLTPTAENPLVRVVCNAQPSANTGRGQWPRGLIRKSAGVTLHRFFAPKQPQSSSDI